MSNSSFNSSNCKFRISKEHSCHSEKVEFNMYKPYFEEAFPEFEVVDLHINVVMKCFKGKVIVSISNCNSELTNAKKCLFKYCLSVSKSWASVMGNFEFEGANYEFEIVVLNVLKVFKHLRNRLKKGLTRLRLVGNTQMCCKIHTTRFIFASRVSFA